jgi:DNA-binding LytR/AlgR family response regulator
LCFRVIFSFHLIAICNNALIAYSEIQNNHVDLVFLDINMPRMTGIQFIKSLHEPPMVIFTTAYPEYAVEGFEVDAIDYLVKPFSFERFLKAINKAAEKFKLKYNLSSEEYVWMKADKKMHKVELNSILIFKLLVIMLK